VPAIKTHVLVLPLLADDICFAVRILLTMYLADFLESFILHIDHKLDLMRVQVIIMTLFFYPISTIT
jgi:hypothetical protein